MTESINTLLSFPFPTSNHGIFRCVAGSAILLALKYLRDGRMKHYTGNVLIAPGGLLSGIGGSFIKFGYIAVRYVTELLGILLIYAGYRIIRNESRVSPVRQVSLS